MKEDLKNIAELITYNMNRTKQQLKEIQEGFKASLKNWEEILWELEAKEQEAGHVPDEYSDAEMVYACKLFSHTILNKLYYKLKRDGSDNETGELTALAAGNAMYKLVKKYTGVDTKEFYN